MPSLFTNMCLVSNKRLISSLFHLRTAFFAKEKDASNAYQSFVQEIPAPTASPSRRNVEHIVQKQWDNYQTFVSRGQKGDRFHSRRLENKKVQDLQFQAKLIAKLSVF